MENNYKKLLPKDINKEYNRLMEEFKQSERDKEIRQQAVNEYKQILDSKDKSVQS